jgi:HD superfamily phosphohydrolase YqeK
MRTTDLPSVAFPNWAHIKKKRQAHVRRVAQVCEIWAEKMGVVDSELHRLQRAVALHDALKDAPEDLLCELAPDAWGVGALRHGPAAAARAERDGEKDGGVLDAVRYHSVGYQQWDLVGRMLYLADFLEPGRSYHTAQHSALLERVPDEMESVLRLVAAERIAGIVLSGGPLPAETTDFWNALIAEY